MALSEDEFESWCFRNGGETYEHQGTTGVVCQFPDTETADRIGYYESNGVFEVITDGWFYQSRSLHQHADSWIDEDDRLHIDTGETRVIVDPS
jgi:hypothetical protein